MKDMDTALMNLTAVSLGLFGSHALLAPQSFQDTYYEKTQATNLVSNRWFGNALMCMLGTTLVAANGGNMTAQGKKRWLQAAAPGLALSAAMDVTYAAQGKQRKAFSYLNGAATAALTGAAIYSSTRKVQ